MSRPARSPPVHYDPSQPAVVINHLTVTDPAVVAESHRWSRGQRGVMVSDAELTDVDLSTFVTQALTVGAHAIGSAGGLQDTFNLESLVNDVGVRTADAASKAAVATGEVVNRAAETLEKASTDARKAITEAGGAARKSFSDNVDAARQTLTDEINRIFGGENPELLGRITPMLETFSHNLNAQVATQTTELITKAARQFDPADPTSPMAKHNQELKAQQAALTSTLQENHRALEAKVDELTTAVKVSKAAEEAAARTARRTPLKGETYEQQIHTVMAEIAIGLGDEYTATGAQPGILPRCKKGDGVLSVQGGSSNVVLEMTDSKRPGWNSYLDEAERNRLAAASLGLVPSVDLNDGHGVRCLGQRRIVMAFDPMTDDPELLRTVVQILRLGALAANARQDTSLIETAREKIADAIGLLAKIDGIKRVASQIKTHANRIELDSESTRTELERMLTHAQTALDGAGDGEAREAA